jgi:orotidine-5'-phosphate decarboxylase
MKSFGERLAEAVEQRGPLCVGIDPHASLLLKWGLPDSAEGAEIFATTVIDALGDRVAVLKPQSAFFERFGSAGIAVLESTIRQSREVGALVLLDVKRGDIASTAQAYAEAYLNPASPLYADAMTVSPYLGVGSQEPMLAEARAHGSGVFVLARTSNPDSHQLQEAVTDSGVSVAQTVIDAAAAANQGAQPLGSVGVVVGATRKAAGLDLSRLNGPVLAPGLGAQGATAEDLAVFASVDGLVLPSYSREVLAEGPGIDALRAAAVRADRECRIALKYPIS